MSYKLRVRFSKNGPIRFIGHLDTMRYFQKAVRRADIPVCYSGGYSPHQIMSFAYPLGVGMTTDGDYMDIEVESLICSTEIINRLNSVMADGIVITDAVLLPEKSTPAMACVSASGYKVSFRDGKEPSFDMGKAVAWFNDAQNVPYVKVTAKSEIEMDLKKSVYEIRLNEDGSLYMMLDSSSAGNIKPSLVLEAIYKNYNEDLPDFPIHVHRIETYMRDESGSFVPLLAAGSVIE